MNIKKANALVVILSALVLCVTGCSSDKSSDTDTSSAESSQSESSESQSSESTADIPAQVTLITQSESSAAQLKDISAAKIELPKKQPYTGKEITPAVKVTLNGEQLAENKDYTLTYSENKLPGFNTAKVTVSGTGGFSGSLSAAFSIVPPKAEGAKASTANSAVTLSWNAIEGVQDFEVVWSKDESFKTGVLTKEVTKANKASVSQGLSLGDNVYLKVRPFVRGENEKLYGEYSDGVKCQVKGSVTSIQLSQESYTYNEKAQTPTASVYSGKTLLAKDKDYTLTMSGSTTKPGIVTVKAAGKGNYVGTVTKTYVIKPKKNEIKDISTKSNNITLSWNKDTDSQGYMILYSTDKSFKTYQKRAVYNNAKTTDTFNTGSYGKVTWYVKVASIVITDSASGKWAGIPSDPRTVEMTGPEKPKPVTETTAAEAKSMAELQEILKKQISAYPGSWSIYIKNLTTQERVVINNKKYYPASLMKLFCMAATYQAIEEGRIKEASVSTELRYMITVSSDGAFNTLLGKIGYTAIRDWIKKNGYTDTYQCRGYINGPNYQKTIIGSGNNLSNVTDMGKLLESIYNGTCVSKEASAKMMKLLKAQQLTHKIPKGVPSGVVTANKTGDVPDNTHDCAIVFLEGNPYILCVMTQINGTALQNNDKISKVSSTVYSYMKNHIPKKEDEK